MERKLRLTTGLILFAYVASHFLGHATGMLGLTTMEAVGRGVILAPWRVWPGRTLLFVSLLIHGGLGLYALYKRRTLRMPPLEGLQLILGLTIPFLLTPHILTTRVGPDLFHLDGSYQDVLYRIWTAALRVGNMFTLLLMVWTHGCLGLNFWLKKYEFYRRRRDAFLVAAVAAPFLALLGLVNAGWDAATAARLDPAFAAAHGPPAAGSAPAASTQTLDAWGYDLQRSWLVLILVTLVSRFARDRLERGPRGVRVTYPDGRVVVAPRGFSILETSRWAGVPHASACGGRGRCSTCRVQIVAGLEDAPEPSTAERDTLDRVKASSDIRLACQLRPIADISVLPLLAADLSPRADAGFRETREVLATALFIDLRDSTKLAAGRMPFDALYIVDRYVQAVSDSVEAHGGVVTTVAGDGVMCIFGARADPPSGARGALRAVAAIWNAIEALSRDFAAELEQPLGFGIGIHTGLAVVTSTSIGGKASLQFVGDAGNIASRLEAATKILAGICVVSEAAFNVARVEIPDDLAREELAIRGLEGRTLPVVVIRRRAEADRLSAPPMAEKRRERA
jgi:adenylate cyclase